MSLNDQRDFLDVEDDEQRQHRIGGLLERLNNSTSTSTPVATPNIGHQGPPPPVEVPTELLERVKAFLPAISASNAALTHIKPEDIDIENVQEDEEQYIEMNLGLGVFEAKPRAESGPRSASPSSEEDASLDTSSESKFDSEYTHSGSEEETESDSSSDDDDSESQSGSSVDTKPVFPRPIKPLPRRLLGKAKIPEA